MKRILAMMLLMLLVAAGAAAEVTITKEGGMPEAIAGNTYTVTSGAYVLSGETTNGLYLYVVGNVELIIKDLKILSTTSFENGLHLGTSSSGTVKLTVSGEGNKITGHKDALVSEIPVTIGGTGKLVCESIRIDDPYVSNVGRVGIRAYSDLTITGGTLEVTTGSVGSSAIGIEAKKTLTITGGKLDVQGLYAAIDAYGKMSVSNAELVLAGSDVALWVHDELSITDSSVDAQATGSYSLGIYSQNAQKPVTIDGGYVNAVGVYSGLTGTVQDGIGNDIRNPSFTYKPGSTETVTLTYYGMNGESKKVSFVGDDGLGYVMLKPQNVGIQIPQSVAFEGWLVNGRLVKAGEKINVVSDTEARPSVSSTFEEDLGGSMVTDGAERMPQTGDNSALGLWIMLMGAAGAAMMLRKRAHN